jgi:hypothetical protein
MTLQVTLDDDSPKENRDAGITDLTESECAIIAEYLRRSRIEDGKMTIRSRYCIIVNGDVLTLAEITFKLQEMDASEDVADQRSTYNE